MAYESSQPSPAYAPPVAITTQPTTVIQQTVVVNQPVTQNQWKSGLCACGEDIKSCCCVLCCGNVYYGAIAIRMGENYCVGCNGYPAGCVPGGHMAMRTAIRNKHGIQGDICGDCCAVNFCLPCVMCQISREMDHLGYPSGSC